MNNRITQKAIRVRGLSKAEVNLKALGIGRISYNAIGSLTFINGEHKGYEITSYNEVIGFSDSLQNIDNLKMLLGEKDIFGTAVKLTFRGRIVINDNDTNLFSDEVLKVFTEATRINSKVVIKDTLSPTDHKELLKGTRKRARKRF